MILFKNQINLYSKDQLIKELKMKVQEENNFQSQIKFLHKKFKILDKPNTKILYQFCQFDAERSYKVLAVAKTLRNSASIIQSLLKNPEKSEQYIDSLVQRFDKEINQPIDLQFIQKAESKKVSKELIKLQFDFFEEIPEDTVGTIMSFLDPYSYKLFTFTCSRMNKIGKALSISQLYKQICKVLFSMNQPVLPFICRFQTIKKFVIEHPEQYFPYFNNFKNAVTNNLRNYIWKIETTDYKLDKNYYLSFGSYQNLFQKCPRTNLNGYYVCKHKYVKIGEKNMVHVVTPIHIIYYYRYLRFLEDGSVIYHVSNRKLKSQDVLKALSKELLVNQPEKSIIGEFMQYKDRVYLKAVKQNSVFCYEMEIKSTENKICNELKVLNYKLELIDKSYMSQILFQAHPNKEDLIFNYCYNEDIQNQNSSRIKACSL